MPRYGQSYSKILNPMVRLLGSGVNLGRLCGFLLVGQNLQRNIW
jgi:hypothetical protein